ncbi:MAG: class I SAM-dependent methyltransferase [Parcubacteria group bacterium]|nr:class I SAM-dependent methyltransferase [Parcubacteria group bacterium]
MEKHYSEVSSTWRNFEDVSSELGIIREDLKGKIILDIGSGGAGFAEGVKQNKELKSRVISLDPNYNLETLSEENRDLMRNAVKEINKEGLDAVAGLSESLPFKNESFDLIISNHAVPWHIAEDAEKVTKSIKEIIRTLKPGGEVKLHPVEEETFKLIENVVGDNCSVEIKKKVLTIRKEGGIQEGNEH